jgi:hypothetical protein
MLRRISPVVIAACSALVLPATSFAQATRTWVSGVGDDANPCSRTAPCKTLAGAFSKTAVGGEIDALDPGGYGALTITHSITIDGGAGQVASVLVAGTNGIVVAAGPTDQVTIRSFRINGLGQTSNPGLNGVDFLSGGTLRLENVNIFGFSQSGVSDTSTNSMLAVSDSTISGGRGDGVMIAPPAGSSATAILENDVLENNECGVAAGAFGATGTFTTHCGLADSGSPATAVNVSIDPSSASENTDTGVLSDGSPTTVYLSGISVFGNATGLAPVNGGSIVAVGPSNFVYGNGNNGNATSTVGAGAQGPPGAPGVQGPPGQVVLITCKTKTIKIKVKGKRHRKHKPRTKTVEKCSARPITGTVTFTVTSHLARATLSRDGRVYAAGDIGTAGGLTTGYLRLRTRLRPARYVLTLTAGGRVRSRRAVYLS